MGKLQWFQEYYGMYYVLLEWDQRCLHRATFLLKKKKNTLSFKIRLNRKLEKFLRGLAFSAGMS